jgi:hypothetical protein
VGTVGNSASPGSGTLTVGGTTANPTININFPASSGGGSGGTAWSSGTEYPVGTVASDNANLYVATVESTDVEPGSGTTASQADWAGLSPGSSFSWIETFVNSQDTNPNYIAPISGTAFTAAYTETPGVGVAYSPASCTVRSLSVHAILQSGSDDNITVLVRHNGSNTTMSCVAQVTAGNANCSNANQFFVAAGDTLEYEVTQTNGSPNIITSTLLTCN